jgi:hypothetical protein
VHRWTHIDGTTIRRWEWRAPEGEPDRQPHDDDEADELDAVSHNRGRLPVVRLQLPPALHAMGLLRDGARNLTRTQNALDHGLYIGAHPLLVVLTKALQAGKPLVGAGAYMQLEPGDDVRYVEPSGATFKLQADREQVIRDSLFRTMHQMAAGVDAKAAATAKSGVSKALDWQALEIVLTALSAHVKGMIGRALALHPRLGGDEAPQIGGLGGWEKLSIEEFLTLATGEPDLFRMSERATKLRASKVAERLFADQPEALEEIRREIEAADHQSAPPVPAGLSGLFEDPSPGE